MAGTYHMTRHTIVAPTVRNDGTPSGYPEALRAALLAHGYDGWTETDTRGTWHGKVEPGVTFELLREPTVTRASWPKRTAEPFHESLCVLARQAFGPEQKAIQVTYEPGHAIVLTEA